MSTRRSDIDPGTKPTPQQQGESIPDNDSLKNDDRGTAPYQRKTASVGQSDAPGDKPDNDEPDNEPDNDEPGKQESVPDPVEIGDPVPQDDRTTRADSR